MRSVSGVIRTIKAKQARMTGSAWAQREGVKGAVPLPLELFEDYYPKDEEGSPGSPDLLMVADVKNKGLKNPLVSILTTPGRQR